MKPDASRHDPRTDAQRAAKYKRSGRQIACVIRDPDALAALRTLERKHGGVTAAVTHALTHALLTSTQPAHRRASRAP